MVSIHVIQIVVPCESLIGQRVVSMDEIHNAVIVLQNLVKEGQDMSKECPTITGTGDAATFDMKFLYELSWSRFGNIKLERWDNNRKTWIVQ